MSYVRIDLTGGDPDLHNGTLEVLATDEAGRTITVAKLLASFPPSLVMHIMLEISRAYGLNAWYDSTGKVTKKPNWVIIRRGQDWVILPDLED